MSTMRWTFLILTALSLAPSPLAASELPRGTLRLSVEVITNPVAGSPRVDCAWTEDLSTLPAKRWSLKVSGAKSAPSGEDKAAPRNLRCEETYAKGSADLEGAAEPAQTLGTFAVSARLRPSTLTFEKVLNLNVSVTAGSSPGDSSAETRTLVLIEGQDAFVPLLMADEAEKASLGLHEVWVRIASARTGAIAKPVYGALDVRTGESGGELLLDGGVVASLEPNSEVRLPNVRVGMRAVALRAVSGSEPRKSVRIEANRASRVFLGSEQPAPYRLEPLSKNEQGYEEYRRSRDGATVVKIPAGEFLMGNKETERTPFEHTVYVSEFLIDKLGVTWGQYKKFAEDTGTTMPPRDPYWGMLDEHPAVFVTWEDANSYCAWAGARLPTEAEREKAARGTDRRKYPWGNEEPTPELGVFRRAWGMEATAAVGTHPAGVSPYGAMDMGGNVWEWCSDWYSDEYLEQSPKTDPQGPATGTARVLRGGSWDSRPTVLSASCRNWGHHGYREGDFGFRCAMSAPRPATDATSGAAEAPDATKP